jgi:hypothetical protein
LSWQSNPNQRVGHDRSRPKQTSTVQESLSLTNGNTTKVNGAKAG